MFTELYKKPEFSMPFTFAHPAIILPLTAVKKFKLSTSGLVVGSLAPDFEYFIRMKIQSNYSHTLLGLIWFDLPIGLLICFVYHFLVRNSLINNLPLYYYKRIAKFNSLQWGQYFRDKWPTVLFSIFVGSTSHLFWDSFTHLNGYFVKEFSILPRIIELGALNVPVYKVLQHISSALGILFLIITINKLKPEDSNRKTNKLPYWICVCLIGLLVVSISLILELNMISLGNTVVTFISGFMIGLILTPAILRKKNIGLEPI